MRRRAILLVTAIFASTPLWAANGADLTVSLTAPASSTVYTSARYTARVTNSGNKPAATVVLTMQLPPTQTSPEVYVMGTVGAISPACTRAGTTLTCGLGTVNRNSSSTVFFDIAFPYSTEALVINASVTSQSREITTLNNGTFIVASPQTVNTPVVTGVTATNSHCTGQPSLSSYFECVLFTSSGAITSHETIFNANGTISFVGAPASYSGTWFANAAVHQLHFRYFEGTTLVAEFDGRGVNARCFEGKTTFPNNPSYVSLYLVCFP